jgi:para-aminobenzoate synthetase component 1
MHIEPVKTISPVDAFIALSSLPRPFILSGGIGRRFSFVGAGPFMELTTASDGTFLDGRPFSHDPFEALSVIFSGYRHLERGPFPFNGGGVGYFSYDLKDVIEKPRGRKRTKKGVHDPGGHVRRGVHDPLPAALCSVGFYDPVYVYDHVEGKGFIVSAGTEGANRRLKEVKGALKSKGSSQRATAPDELRSGGYAGLSPGNRAPTGRPIVSNERLYPITTTGVERFPAAGANFTREGYIEAIKSAHSYIAAGDIYQINLSQRLTIPLTDDPFALYSRLINERPARFSSYIDLGPFKIISNTPERLLKVSGRTVETQPIKGTRPRGIDPEEDSRYIEELKDSVKERAEHVMVVDLERNDLGRVSVVGSVEVSEFLKIETYPGLHHMVSTVRGELRPGLDGFTALRASFPGGSVTGTPKIRAMEIIEELEPTPRGIYTGGVGFMDLSGDMDISMAIRTAIHGHGLLQLNVGGGIVADSVPEEEYDETILKAMDFLNLIL